MPAGTSDTTSLKQPRSKSQPGVVCRHPSIHMEDMVMMSVLFKTLPASPCCDPKGDGLRGFINQLRKKASLLTRTLNIANERLVGLLFLAVRV